MAENEKYVSTFRKDNLKKKKQQRHKIQMPLQPEWRLWCAKMNARMCVVTQDEHCFCEWRWVMAKAALGRIAGLSHFSGGRSGADKLTPPPPHRARVEEEDEIRACFPMLLPRQEPAGGRL